jgi:hypothetical protein
MTRRILITSAVIALGLPALTSADTANQPAQPKAKAAAKGCEKNPAAIKRLDEMGAFLRDQKTFSVRSQTATDEVLENGQKIQLSATNELEVHRPDRLHASFKSDRRQREFFYDGKSFTVYSPTNGYYAQVPAPPTIDGLLGKISEKYDIELPLADLFLWGTPSSGVELLECAEFIGPSKINGSMTDQFAFRQDGLDWQIWIEQGERPLPRRLVLTTTTDPARPQHEVALDWNLAPKLDQQAFQFSPPKGAQKIEIVDATTDQTATREQPRR